MEKDPANCRLCLTIHTSNLFNIFDEQSGNENIATVLGKHFWFQIKEDDVNKYICAICWSKVADFHSFYTQVYHLHNELYSKAQELVKVEMEIDNTDESIANCGEVNCLELKPNLKNEVFETVPSDTSEFEDDYSDKSYDPRVDPTINDDNTSSSDDFLVNSCSKKNSVSKNSSQSSNKKVTTIGGSIDYHSGDTTDVDDNRSAVLRLKSIRLQTITRKCSENNVKTNDVLRNQLELDEENKQIQEYFTMECELCSIRCETFKKLKLHYKNEHKMKGYLWCCNRKFTNQTLLVQHIQRHLNPELFKCELCFKNFASQRSLDCHLKRHRDLENKSFKCTVCSKCFRIKAELENHLITHNSEKNFICDDCGKSFHTEKTLQTHSKYTHERAGICICDVCGKEFRNKSACDKHKRGVHDNIESPKVKCNVCGIWLKQVSLRKHMVAHEESKVDHFCSICGKQSPNRKALRKHINTVHSDKVYKCMVCDKTFKKEISLKEHMPTHTGDTLYSCPHCPKKFNSSGNMYRHRKLIHVKEWEEHERLKAAGVL